MSLSLRPSRPPRVAVLIHDPLTHDSRLFKECRSLRIAGYEVHVFGSQPADASLPVHFRMDDCDYHRPASLAKNWFRRKIGWHVQAIRFVQRLRPEVILNHRWHTLTAAVPAALLTGTPLIYDNRELFGGGNFTERSFAFRQSVWMLERVFCRGGVDEVIMSSPGRAEEWARKYGFRKPRVMYDCAERRQVDPSDALRREYGLDEQAKILVYVGALDGGRGLLPAVEALTRLPANYVMVALGYGARLAAQMRETAERLNVGSRLFVHDPVPHTEVPSFISSADVSLCNIENVSRSYYHSVPQKFYESLQAGVPLLTSNFPEMARLVRQFDVGVCCDPSNPDELAKAILRLTTGPVSREEYRRRCQQASDALSWENEVKQLLEAVEQAVASQHGKTR